MKYKVMYTAGAKRDLRNIFRYISEMYLSAETIRICKKGIHETTEYLEAFHRNLLLNEKNEFVRLSA